MDQNIYNKKQKWFDSRDERKITFVRITNWLMIIEGILWIPMDTIHNSHFFTLITFILLTISGIFSLILLKYNQITTAKGLSFISVTLYFLITCFLTEGSYSVEGQRQQVHFWFLVLASFSYFFLYDNKPLIRDIVPVFLFLMFYLFHFGFIPIPVIVKYPGVEAINRFTIFLSLIAIYIINRQFVLQIVKSEEALIISANNLEESIGIVTKQKIEVEVKNREILDSIKYAKRLQNAIMPSNKLIKECLPDSFIFYKPKNIVAGDFYWVYPKPLLKGDSQGEQIIFFAAADCTGHGVPGAMVSVVCANALNKAVRELKLSNPGKILDEVSELVEKTFLQSGATHEDYVQDGMDISLCALNLKTLKLEWSGAHNPLLIIRKPSSSYQEGQEMKIKELRPDNQPIGYFPNRKPFTTHTVQLEKGEMLYLFTDGYADQFGGTEGKKLYSKNFKAQLLAISSLPLDVQLLEIEKHFEIWKGNNEQVDDVCVIGVKV
jgi:serine phosphatase RsbU (regulator of sigma subunit)